MMAVNPTENSDNDNEPAEPEFERERLEARFAALYKRDPWLPAAIAARAALRVFPLIGIDGHFDFWATQTSTAKQSKEELSSSPTDQDKRAFYLLAISFACQNVLYQSAQDNDKRQGKLIAYAAYAAARAARAASDAAARAAYAAAAAAFAADIAAAARAADAAAARAADAADAFGADVARGNILQNLSYDLQQAEQGLPIAELVALPLWPASVSEELEQLYLRQFMPAVHDLIKEITASSPESANALNRMLSQYEERLGGQIEPEQTTIYKPSETLAAENGSGALDKLNRENLVKGLSTLLSHKDNNEHLTIGLLGHWGAGKTRVLQLLKQAIKHKTDKSCGFLFGEFNAWAYEHAKNPQAAMAHEVIKSLTTCQRTIECTPEDHWLRQKAQPFANVSITTLWKLVIRSRLSFGFMVAKYPWRLLMLFVWPSLVLVLANYALSSGLGKDDITAWQEASGIGAIVAALFSLWRIPKELRVLLAQPYTKELLSYIKLPDYAQQIGEISEMRKDIELMVNIRLGTEQGQRLYGLGKVLPRRRLLFVVDDLDRCSPEGIVKTFEAIRLVLDLPQVIVVVAVDQRIALAALALHYEKLTKHHQLNDAKAIARDYLAKMIQLPIVVGDGDFATLQGYMSHLWQDSDPQLQQWQAFLVADSEKPNTTKHTQKPQDADTQQNIDLPKAALDEKIDKDKGASEEQLAKWVLALPLAEQLQKVDENFGLSDRQKAAFAYWAEQFELRNARQVKRLYNSYNLMRLVSDEEDVPIEQEDEKFAYGLMLTLLSIEFINGIENNRQRSAMGLLLRDKVVSDKISDVHRLLLHKAIDIIDAVAQQRQQFAVLPEERRFGAMLDFVGLFVLPAIDGFSADETHAQ